VAAAAPTSNLVRVLDSLRADYHIVLAHSRFEDLLRQGGALIVDLSEGAHDDLLVMVGIAIGIESPVLIVAESIDGIPIVLRQLPRVITRGLRDKDLAIQLDAFLASTRSPVTAKPSSRPPLTPAAHVRLEGLGSFKARQPASNLEEKVADLLQTAGGVVVFGPSLTRSNLYRPDIAVSFTGMDASLPPVLVEVVGVINPRIESKLQALRATLASRKLPLGMVVVASSLIPPEYQRLATPEVLLITLEELSRYTLSGALVEFLRTARNRSQHGGEW